MTRTNHNNDEMNRLLARAAALASAQDVEGEQFMVAAWEAFLVCHPGVREQLEDKALRTELNILRQQGRIACA